MNFLAEEINPYIIRCGYINAENCPPKGAVYPQRKVRWYEIEFILEGEGYILTEGNKIAAKEGGIFFRRPGMTVQGVSPYFCYLIVFDMVYDAAKLYEYNNTDSLDCRENKISIREDFGLSKGDLLDFDFPHFITTSQIGKFQKMFSEVYEEYITHRKGTQFFLKTHLLQLLMLYQQELGNLHQHFSASRSHRMNYQKVMCAKQYIDTHIHHSFKLLELAEIAGLSPNFFCRIFREITGDTLVTYINREKTNVAKKILMETNKGIKQIAYECGFENDTYFYSLFKKQTGFSPAEFRARYSVVQL